jgi:hypothetical protein
MVKVAEELQRYGFIFYATDPLIQKKLQFMAQIFCALRGCISPLSIVVQANIYLN